MQQPKRITIQTKNMPQGRSPKQSKKQGKIKQIKSKIFKNLNEIPIQLNHEHKENRSHNQPQRPISSLVDDSHSYKPTRAVRVESAMSQYPEYRQSNNRKRLSLDSTGKRYERDSIVSKNSACKKMSKNNKSIEEGIKIKITEQRKKSNLSCASVNEEGLFRTSKKHSVKHKRPSVGNLHLPMRAKDKENRDPKPLKKNSKSKSRSKSKHTRKKSKVHLDKSKVSSTAFNTQDRVFVKKKQSTSTAHIGVALPKKKKKTQKKKQSPRMPSNLPNDQFSVQQYPINKYGLDYSSDKITKQKSKKKSRSKSRKGSLSKQRKKSVIQIDYMSCINIPSNSSGLIGSHSSKISSRQGQTIKIVDTWEFKYNGESNNSSVNLEEIRYFQSMEYAENRQEKQFMDKKFKNKDKYQHRQCIEDQMVLDYPHFGELQLKFLTSVVFIQRKWRQYRLYKDVIRNIAASAHKKSQVDFQQQNSVQLNISSTKSPLKSATKKPVEQLEQNEKSNKDSKDSLDQVQRQSAESKRLRNRIYLDYAQIDDDDLQEHLQPVHTRGRMKQQLIEHQKPQQSEQNVSDRSQRYQFLQQDLFPSANYLRVKKQQLKDQLYRQFAQFNQLQRTGVIDGREYLKLRAKSETQYEKELNELQKSRKDIKKGYLKYIDIYQNIKQEGGLRRVSSESGPMSSLYMKVFNLDLTVKTHSESSESMKRLTKRVLIRKQYFQNHKIDQSLHNPTILNTRSAREKPKQDSASFSARYPNRQFFLGDLSKQKDNLKINRIKQGYLITPQSIQSQQKLSPVQIDIPEDTQLSNQQPILDQVLAQLTHQLFVQLVKIDERRQNSIDIIQVNSQQEIHSLKVSDIGDFQLVEENDSEDIDRDDRDEDLEVIEEKKLRQIFKIEGIADKEGSEPTRRHRNSNIHHISPANSEPHTFESEQIVYYCKQLFQFMSKGNRSIQLLKKLNKNQGFTPKEYLKFLRDYEIPEQEYQPLIPNEIFVQWEDTFYNKEENNKEDYMKRQATTIFHRCIFQCIIGLLQDQRPSGDKGEPFPWQKVIYFKRPLSLQKMPLIFQIAIHKLSSLTELNCGIIQQKRLIVSEDDLQRLHEQNEDKIINMLQSQLEVSPHCWYEVEQHSLEIKLEIEIQIFEYIMLEALDEVLEIL